MIPLEVTLKNFLGYDDNDGAAYCYDFRDHRLWSISGDNGAGKSAIFDVISYTLFGRHRGGASRDEELLRKGAHEMSCSFSFEHNARPYRITRTIKKRIKRSGEAAYDRACELDWYDRKANAWREVPGTSTVTALEEHVRTVLLGVDYDTFISSVLLLQGDSDKLIRSGARDRFTYLSGILDLRQYKRLEDRAVTKAKTLDAQYKLLENTLREVGIPAQEDVDAAEARAAQGEQAASNAQVRLQETDNRLKRVEGYHALTKRRAELVDKASEMSEALAHAEDIRAAIEEKRTLNQTLPRVREARGALYSAELAEGQVREAQKQAGEIDLGALRTSVKGAEVEHEKAEAARDQNAELLRHKRQNRRGLDQELKLARRLEELVGSIELATATIAELEKATAGLLGMRVKLARLEALDRGRLLIKAFAQARLDEGELETWFGDRDPQSVIEGVVAACLAAEKNVEDLRRRMSQQRTEHGRFGGELAVAQRTLQERVAAGAAGTCSRCGQPVSNQHIKDEIAKCKKQIVELQSAMDEVGNAMKSETVALSGLEGQLPALRQEEQHARERVSQLAQVRKHLIELRADEAMAHLPDDCRTVLEGPANQIDSELEPFRTELAGLPMLLPKFEELSSKAADLRSQQELTARWQTEKEKILQGMTMARAHAVVANAAELDTDIVGLEANEEALAKAAAGTQDSLEAARNVHVAAVQKKTELQNTAQLHATAAEGNRAAAAATLRGIDQRFLPPSKEKIAQVEIRLRELADAEEKLALLEAAEKQLATLRGRISELEEALAKTVGEDRIPVEDAKHALELARQASKLAQDGARSARERAVTLSTERAQRLAMQRQADDLARAHKVWDRLGKLLGRGGIQLALMKRDLAEIEKLANVMLTRISGGNLQITIECLRGRTGEEIVFRCVDAASADEALDVVFLSGGQKFRVAVALAVGIAQYAGLGGSMPSQIIDEGFGSLDENGRKEMLEAIRDMSQYFERIIVVSHTDSFHDPALFPARYELRKEGRKTLVTASI